MKKKKALTVTALVIVIALIAGMIGSLALKGKTKNNTESNAESNIVNVSEAASSKEDSVRVEGAADFLKESKSSKSEEQTDTSDQESGTTDQAAGTSDQKSGTQGQAAGRSDRESGTTDQKPDTSDTGNSPDGNTSGTGSGSGQGGSGGSADDADSSDDGQDQQGQTQGPGTSDTDNYPAYTPGSGSGSGQGGSESSPDNTDSDSSEQSDQEQSQQETQVQTSVEEMPEIPTISFPYTVSESDLVIQQISSYDGYYIEDASDHAVSGVAAIVVTNNGSDLEFAGIGISQGERSLAFSASQIPAGATVIIQEQTGASFSSSEPYYSATATTSRTETFEMSKEYVTLEDSGNNVLTVNNISGKKLSEVKVLFKNYLSDEDVYVGGITYNITLTDVEPDTAMDISAGHYDSQYSKVVEVSVTE